jgi:predicted translin family RNA/ssDNA-binding protein
VRVTPSARKDLLEAVARLRRGDPERAERFVLEVEDRLTDLTESLETAPELESAKHSATAAEGHRLYLRERASGMWLIAVWPDRSVRDG